PSSCSNGSANCGSGSRCPLLRRGRGGTDMIPFVQVISLLVVLQSSAPLADHFTAIAKTSGGGVGVFAQVIESHDSAGLAETERFPMQSVYKLPIAMAVLDQVDRKALTLNQKVSLSS